MADIVLRAELDRAGLAGLVEVDSAGTGDWHLGEPMAEQAEAELARRGYDGSAHRARRIQPAWFAERDLVLAMDLSNLAALRALAPDAEAAGPRDGGVPDPYGGPPAGYAQALDMVQRAVRGLVGRLAEVDQVPAGGA